MEVILKKGKDRAISLGHSWIFSGAIERAEAEDGRIVCVKSHKGDVLGFGYYNSRSQIRVRILSFGKTPYTIDHLRTLIMESFGRRKDNPFLETSNAWRAVFSEGDFLPGLIIDNFNGHMVAQFLTLGIDTMKDDIISILEKDVKALSLYERSDYGGRKLEGLADSTGQLFGNTPDEIEISEHGIRYPVDVKHGQKTGFFLDQRENRALIKSIAAGKKVLNLFSYSAGFTFAAITGGAASTRSVDVSRSATEAAEKIYTLNGFSTPSQFIAADAFDFARNETIDEDLVIIDPPAFAKSRNNVDNACRGYKDINMQVIGKTKPGTYILTCSCSRFIDASLFQKVIFSAVNDAGKRAQIIRKTGHPADHPVNIAVPETEYLKGILLRVV